MLIFFHLVQMLPIWPTNHAYLLRLRLGKDVYIVLASCEDLPSSATEQSTENIRSLTPITPNGPMLPCMYSKL